MADILPDNTADDLADNMADVLPDNTADNLPDNMADDLPDNMADVLPHNMADDLPDIMADDLPDNMADILADILAVISDYSLLQDFELFQIMLKLIALIGKHRKKVILSFEILRQLLSWTQHHWLVVR